MLKAACLSWDAVSRILEDAILGILHKTVRIRAWSEDADYWGAMAVDYRFSLEDLNQLLDAVRADDEVRIRTFPDDDTSTNSFGMDLGNLLLKREQGSDWADTHITQSCLWLLDYSNKQIHPYSRSGFLESIPRDRLMSEQEVKEYLDCNGGSDKALSEIRERYLEEFGSELSWRYPITDEFHLGAFILAVKEGYLHIPYDGVYMDEYELLDESEIALHTRETLKLFLSDWIRFSDNLEDALKTMIRQEEKFS